MSRLAVSLYQIIQTQKKSQENSSYELESDLDISFNSESGSEWVPTAQDLREREREMSDNEKISIKKKTKYKKKEKIK